jgi:hypothetical protein
MSNHRDAGSEPQPPASVLDVPGATLPLATLLASSSCACAGPQRQDEGRRPTSSPATRGARACCGDG